MNFIDNVSINVDMISMPNLFWMSFSLCIQM